MIPRPHALALLLPLAAWLADAPGVAAQGTGNGYLFDAPSATVTVRGGFGGARAASDVFDFATEELTVDRGDFDGGVLGADVAIHLLPRLDVVLGAEYAASATPSEFRDWVDDDDRPIEQTTRFRRVPLTAGARLYLSPRGRSVGRFAWVPARVAPYVGGGAGAMWFRFEQEGDFVDFETLEVFPDRFESSGWTPTTHALAGLDVSLHPRVGLATQLRYTWAEGELDRTFQDFDPIDLSGLAATVGINVRL